MKNNSRCPAIGAVVTAAAIISLSGCAPKTDSNPSSASVTATNVKLSPAQRQNIRIYKVDSGKYRRTIETSGAVDFDNDQATSVLAPFSGPVSRLLVSLGDRVKKGDPLAEVDSPDFAAAIGAYSKALATAKTDRRLADQDKDLIEHHGVSQREAEQAETDAVNAEADRDAALQALVSLNVHPQTIKDIQAGRPILHAAGIIRSPIAGNVVEKLITPGELLQAGTTPCFTVANLSRVWVMAQVFGSDLASVNLGDSAEVVTGNPGEFLKKQMYVHVLIRSRQESSGLLVPVSAILRDDENLPFVYLEQADGSFARQRVTLSYRTDDQYDIAAGLKAGDQVVVDGGIFVQFMQNQ